MAEQKLDIIIEATVTGAVKGLQTVVAALEGVPSASVSASKGIDKVSVAIEKAEKPAFDLGKAIKEAQERISASVDKIAADAISAGNVLENSIGPTVSAFQKLKAAAGSAGSVFNGSTLGASKFVPLVKQIPPALEKVTKSTGSAAIALSNLGRVAQDAPFGFIGIQNNLNPLLESFQRLKSESGSTGGALKALGGSLIGAGGIGLALSAITAAVTFAQMGFRAWGGETKKAAGEAKDALADASKSVAKDLVQLQLYVGFATDVNKSLDERKKAVNALQKEYPQYLKNISDEAILTGQATDAINKSIEALLRKATLSLLKDEIAAVVAESAKQILAVQKGIIATKQAALAEKARAENFGKQTNEFDKQAEAALRSGRALSEIPSTYQKIKSASETAFTNRPDEQIKRITEDLQRQLQPLVDTAINFEDIGTSAEKGTTKAKKAVHKAVEEVKKSLEDLNEISGNLANNRLIINASVKFKADQIKKDIEFLVKSVNTPVEIPVSLGKLKIDVNIQDALDKANAAFKILESRVKEFRGRLFDIIKGMAVDTVSGFAEGIGKALAGEKNPFGAILTVLADGLQSLGKMVIATFITLAALDKALKSIGITNPVVGIAIGAAMVALGAFIKSKVSQTKFAEGGIVSGPLNAQIGEAGQSEVVIPLSRLSGMLNNGNGNGGRVEFIISGQNLLGTLNRATSSYGRTYG